MPTNNQSIYKKNYKIKMLTREFILKNNLKLNEILWNETNNCKFEIKGQIVGVMQRNRGLKIEYNYGGKWEVSEDNYMFDTNKYQWLTTWWVLDKPCSGDTALETAHERLLHKF